MPSSSRNDVVLVRYPFSDLTGSKVRPAVVVSAPHPSQDVFVVPLTSRTVGLLPGEYVLEDWRGAGLRVPTAVKRGVYTVAGSIILKTVGQLGAQDARRLMTSLHAWFALT